MASLNYLFTDLFGAVDSPFDFLGGTSFFSQEVISDPLFLGGQGLSISSTASGTSRFYAQLKDAIVSQHTDVEILLLYKVNVTGQGPAEMAIRGDYNSGNPVGYRFNMDKGVSPVRIGQEIRTWNGSGLNSTTIANGGQRNYDDGLIYTRVQVEGSIVRIKSWGQSDPEPVTWGAEVSNATYTSGQFNISSYRNNVTANYVAYNWVGVETDSANWPVALPTSSFTQVAFQSITANGESLVTETTELTLGFDIDPGVIDIDFVGVVGATKGTISGTGLTRVLTISNITVPNGGVVAVTITSHDNTIYSPRERGVVVNTLTAPGGETFVYDIQSKSVNLQLVDDGWVRQGSVSNSVIRDGGTSLLGDKYIEFRSGSGTAAITYTAAGVGADQEVLMLLQRDTADGESNKGILRYTGDTYYRGGFRLSTATTSAVIRKRTESEGVFTETAILDTPIENDTNWRWIRFRVEGTSLKLGITQAVDGVPLLWNTETTDSDLATGLLGLGGNQGRTWKVAYFSAATGGAIAPAPAYTLTEVGFTSAIANGESQVTTSNQITLTFSADPVGLDISSITVSNATKGTLTGTGLTRVLTVSDILVPDSSTINVRIAPTIDYYFTPDNIDVTVYVEFAASRLDPNNPIAMALLGAFVFDEGEGLPINLVTNLPSSIIGNSADVSWQAEGYYIGQGAGLDTNTFLPLIEIEGDYFWQIEFDITAFGGANDTIYGNRFGSTNFVKLTKSQFEYSSNFNVSLIIPGRNTFSVAKRGTVFNYFLNGVKLDTLSISAARGPCPVLIGNGDPTSISESMELTVFHAFHGPATVSDLEALDLQANPLQILAPPVFLTFDGVNSYAIIDPELILGQGSAGIGHYVEIQFKASDSVILSGEDGYAGLRFEVTPTQVVVQVWTGPTFNFPVTGLLNNQWHTLRLERISDTEFHIVADGIIITQSGATSSTADFRVGVLGRHASGGTTYYNYSIRSLITNTAVGITEFACNSGSFISESAVVGSATLLFYNVDSSNWTLSTEPSGTQFASNNFLDGGLNRLVNNAERIAILSAYTLADSYAVVTGNILAAATTGTITLSSSGSDRVATSPVVSGTATAAGDADHLAILDDTNSDVLWVTEETSKATIGIGNTVNFPAITYTSKQPVAVAIKFASSGVLDGGLDYISANAERIVLLSAYINGDSYAVVTGNILAAATVTSANFTISSSGTNRQIVSDAGIVGTATVAGTATHIAFLNDTGSEVLWVTDEDASLVVAISDSVSFPALVYTATQPEAAV